MSAVLHYALAGLVGIASVGAFFLGLFGIIAAAMWLYDQDWFRLGAAWSAFIVIVASTLGVIGLAFVQVGLIVLG